MDGPEVLPDSREESLWLQVLNAALAFLAVILFLGAAVLIDTEPWVGARPGVKSIPGPNEDTPLADCGGTSLHVIRNGARVVAETSQLARDAEAACQRVAWTSVVIGVVLFLLMVVSWYGASRVKRRYERGGRLAGPKHLGPSGGRLKSDGALSDVQPQPTWRERIRATLRRLFNRAAAAGQATRSQLATIRSRVSVSGERTKPSGPLWEHPPQPLWDDQPQPLGRGRRFFDVHRVGSHGEPIGVKGLVADIAACLCVFGYSPVILVIVFSSGCTATDSATELERMQVQAIVMAFSISGSFGLLTAIDRRRYDWRWQLAGLGALIVTVFVNTPWF